MKLAIPRIPSHLEHGTLAMLDEGELYEIHLQDVEATNFNIQALAIDGSLMEACSFRQAQLLRISGKDFQIKKSDFSSASLTDGSINRAEFIGCRMAGADFSKTNLHDISFRGCKLDLANFRFADLRRVRFVDCTLSETDFLGATLHDIVFDGSTLEKTVFERAQCKQVDLRGSQLSEIVGWGSMKGVVIDDLQLVTVAPHLAVELGLVVK